jgi:hypothetical protein
VYLPRFPFLIVVSLSLLKQLAKGYVLRGQGQVSTAFQGLNSGEGTIQGKYFNKIVADLQKHNRGTTLDQILAWIITLHGYLSSPTGGGIRHGTDLKAGIATQPDEARLFCNLIRSYITFLLTEHERLSKS